MVRTLLTDSSFREAGERTEGEGGGTTALCVTDTKLQWIWHHSVLQMLVN